MGEERKQDMSKSKNIAIILLQVVTVFALIGTKGWDIGYKVNYNNSFSGYGGRDDGLFEVIKTYNSYLDYVRGNGSSSLDHPNFPSFLLYLLFLLMAVIVVYCIIKLTNKDLNFLNYKVMCGVSGVALLLTVYLMLFSFGKGGNFSFYLKHENPGVKFIILACMIATTLLIVLGERNSSVEMAGAGTKSIGDIFSKMKTTTTNASNAMTTPRVEKSEVKQQIESKDTTDWANTLIQYKALLDEGVITQEEFDKKKSELMK